MEELKDKEPIIKRREQDRDDPLKLKHGAFWNRMDKATRQVDRWPPWVKGSPVNQGNETPPTRQALAKIAEAKSLPR